ncbi:hypothetical protein XENOCAPTIV_021331, partial [Xenoophorus captivus]
ILDKLLDRESQTHKPQTLSSFYSSKPAAGSQRSPSKHSAGSHIGIGGATGGVTKHALSSSSSNTLAASSSSSSSAVALPGEEVTAQVELSLLQNSSTGESTAETKEHGKKWYKGRRLECHAPHVPNQPSEAAAHFYFELAKTVLIKAGGNSSTSIFTQPSASGGHQGPHRNLHLCAFEIGLYALGLHNFVSPNWLSRTYSSHVSWITGVFKENILCIQLLNLARCCIPSCLTLFPFSLFFRPSYGDWQCSPEHSG